MPSTIEQEYEFIELNRTFHELSEHAGKSDDVDLSQVFHVKSRLTWDDVLKNPRTVILSEAGSGKTQEIRNLATRLRAEGKAAFFLRLELIPDDYDIAFEVGTAAEFEAWLNSRDDGYLLLDSVDEARLKSPQDFERAIRKIGKLIEAAKSRVTIILTGRTHAWRPKTDFDLCERHIGAPPKLTLSADEAVPEELQEVSDDDDFADPIETEERPKSSETKFKIVALDDLSREQVAAFASASHQPFSRWVAGRVKSPCAWFSGKTLTMGLGSTEAPKWRWNGHDVPPWFGAGGAGRLQGLRVVQRQDADLGGMNANAFIGGARRLPMVMERPDVPLAR